MVLNLGEDLKEIILRSLLIILLCGKSRCIIYKFYSLEP